MKNVRIEINSVQNGKEVSYLYTHGVMTRSRAGNVSLKIDGASLMGPDGAPVCFSVEGKDKLTVTSGKGKRMSSFVFEQGVRNYCHFAMDEDLAIIGVNAREIAADLDSDGGDIRLEYTLDFNNLPPVVNEMHIHVREELSDVTGLDNWLAKHTTEKS